MTLEQAGVLVSGVTGVILLVAGFDLGIAWLIAAARGASDGGSERD